MGYSFEIVAAYFVLSQHISDLSRDTSVALQFFCSLLCRTILSENEADRFCSTEIKIPACFFFKTTSAIGLLPVEITFGSFVVVKAVEKASLFCLTSLPRFHFHFLQRESRQKYFAADKK